MKPVLRQISNHLWAKRLALMFLPLRIGRTRPARLHLFHPPDRVVENDTPSAHTLIVQPNLFAYVLYYRSITSLRPCLRLRHLLLDVIRIHPVRRRVARPFPSVIRALATVYCTCKRHDHNAVERANLALARPRRHVPSRFARVRREPMAHRLRCETHRARKLAFQRRRLLCYARHPIRAASLNVVATPRAVREWPTLDRTQHALASPLLQS